MCAAEPYADECHRPHAVIGAQVDCGGAHVRRDSLGWKRTERAGVLLGRLRHAGRRWRSSPPQVGHEDETAAEDREAVGEPARGRVPPARGAGEEEARAGGACLVALLLGEVCGQRPRRRALAVDLHLAREEAVPRAQRVARVARVGCGRASGRAPGAAAAHRAGAAAASTN
ncbi:hypothetical protein AB1Y20_015315 [Prymnesium parvum]|uniref:Uncharacterized protein n=1 Tax=Prymnesium parvum TaxID=97485 RepID=A0AB34JXD1_PRYPA